MCIRDRASTGGASDKVPDPNVEPMEIISVYSSNEDATGLNQAMDAVDELTAQSLDVYKRQTYNIYDIFSGCSLAGFAE